MNNNVNYEKNSIVFNYRVGALIRKNNKILVEKNNNFSYYILPGGRCEFNEASIDTGIREMKEETGLDIKYVKSIGLIENFFISNYNHKKYHELFMIHEYEFIDKNNYNLETINNIEDDKDAVYEWIDIDKLKELEFQPKITLDFINSKEFIHYINRD